MVPETLCALGESLREHPPASSASAIAHTTLKTILVRTRQKPNSSLKPLQCDLSEQAVKTPNSKIQNSGKFQIPPKFKKRFRILNLGAGD
jgi:hypothetical protein